MLRECVTHQAAQRDRRQALEPGAVAVDAGEEQRNADARFLVDHGLHVGIHLLAPGLVGLGARGHQQLVELGTLPARLVPRCVGLEELREQRVRAGARVHVAEAHGVGEPVVGPVAVGRHALDIQVQADALARLLQQQRDLGGIHRRGRGDHRDLARHARLLQVEPGLVQVEGALRQAREVEAVGRIDGLVVAQHRVVERDGLLHLLAVEQVLHRQDEVRIRARAHVLAQDEVGVLPRLRGEDRIARRALDAGHGPGVHRGDEVHAAGQQRVHARRLVADADELDLVQVGLAGLPVGVVAHHQGAHARLELLELVRAGADAGVEIRGAVLDDVEVEGAQDHGQVGIGLRQHHRHLARAGGLHAVDLVGQRLGLGGRGRILVAHEREHHVFGRQGLAVVEDHALAQLEHPGLRVGRGVRLGQRRLGGEAAVQREQPVVEHVAARIVGLVGLPGRVQRVGGGRGGARHADAPSPPRRLRMRTGGHGGQAARQGRLHAPREEHGQHIATRRTACQRLHHALALCGADEAVELGEFVAHGGLLVGPGEREGRDRGKKADRWLRHQPSRSLRR